MYHIVSYNGIMFMVTNMQLRTKELKCFKVETADCPKVGALNLETFYPFLVFTTGKKTSCIYYRKENRSNRAVKKYSGIPKLLVPSTSSKMLPSAHTPMGLHVS